MELVANAADLSGERAPLSLRPLSGVPKKGRPGSGAIRAPLKLTFNLV
jgi:hypothetical protein